MTQTGEQSGTQTGEFSDTLRALGGLLEESNASSGIEIAATSDHWLVATGHGSNTHFEIFELEALRQEARKRRGTPTANNPPFSISQALRALGNILDSLGASG